MSGEDGGRSGGAGHGEERGRPGKGEERGRPGYGTVARLFHWTIALMIVVQVPAGIAMTSDPLSAIQDPLFILHKGLGSVLLVLVVARIVWRVTHRPPAFPDYMPPLEKRIAGRTHVAIYALLSLMVVSGYVRTVGDGFPIELLDALGIPPLIPRMPGVAHGALVVHQFTVIALVGLIAVHVSAVLRHQLIEKNPVLARMWPPFGGRHAKPQPTMDASEQGG